MGFFTPLHRDDFTVGRFPLFLMELGGHNFYGFPMFGVDAMKVADHSRGSITTPETVDRAFRMDDEQTLRAFLAAHIPGAAGRLNFGKICLYTNTPDADFILDQHPRHANVVIAAGFSGHGFKFATAVGEVLAELALDGRTRHRIDRFALARFGLKP
jgi:glycine/D-amino acid oxidase-like deaminating enzyme